MKSSTVFTRVLVVAAVGSLVSALPAFAGAQSSTPPDSFLKYQATSVKDLIDEVRSDNVIALHYSEQFGVSQAELPEYFRTKLRVGIASESSDYTCYCVRPNGYIYPTKHHLTRGDRVFTSPDGTPLLEWGTGDPLVPFEEAVHYTLVPVPAAQQEIVVPANPIQRPDVVRQVEPIYAPADPVPANPADPSSASATPSQAPSP
jgi:hypothetical protein